MNQAFGVSLIAMLLSTGLSYAQTKSLQPHNLRTTTEQVNEQARSLAAQHQSSAVFLAHQAFRNVGVPTDVADSFGITNRIVQADALYRNGRHKGVTETDVLSAVNNFADRMQAPAWAHTNPPGSKKIAHAAACPLSAVDGQSSHGR